MIECRRPTTIVDRGTPVTVLDAAEALKAGNVELALARYRALASGDDQAALSAAIGLTVCHAWRRQWEQAEEVLRTALARVPKAGIADAYIASVRLALDLVLAARRETAGDHPNVSRTTATRPVELRRHYVEPAASPEPSPPQLTHDYTHAILTALRLQLQEAPDRAAAAVMG